MSSDRSRPRLLDLGRSPIRRSLGNLGWPILLKEIRSDFRKNRFFITHLVCLLVLAAGILWQVAVSSDGKQAEEIGRDLFNLFFVIQFLVVTVVFPGFSSSALSEERALETFDLLITTDLRPNEIVWGKFLASSIYCLIYIVATIPLLAVSMLFAGVALWEIAVAYLILIGLTVFLAMAGTFISGCFRSTVRSTIVMYLISFAILSYAYVEWKDLLDVKGITIIRALVEGTFTEGVRRNPLLGLLAGTWIAWVFSVPFAFLFILAANRLRPRTDDRTSKLRMLVLATLIPTLLLAHFRGARPGTLVTVSALALFIAGLVFTSEDPRLPPRLRRLFAGWPLPVRIFVPGSAWGLAYMVVLTAAVTALLLGIRAWREPAWDAGGFRWNECFATLPVYLFAYQALGLYLSAGGFTASYTALTVSFVAVITTLLPVIFQIGGRPDGIFSFYYLSPYTLWSSLDPEALRDPNGPRYLLFGAEIIRVAQALYGAAGILFLVLGARQLRRRGPVPKAKHPARVRQTARPSA